MIKKYYIILLVSFLILNGCITQFIPQTSEDKEILVVEGLITDQPGINSIKLSKSLPLGGRSASRPLSGCIVTVSDNLGSSVTFSETSAGYYIPPTSFSGEIGKTYTLHINPNNVSNNIRYESVPVEMKPVPVIDSVFYEKLTLVASNGASTAQEGCQVYVNTHDPTNKCKFYRWEFAETWEFILPYAVPNKMCWISSNSDIINIKSTTVLAEDKINRFPLNFISNESDRLRVKYSILVKQYSLNEDEYLYWEKLQNISQQVGGLYDIIPSSISSNVYSPDDPNEKVLGYFSVSASTTKRLFIKDNFSGLIDLYKDCAQDTIFNGRPIANLNSTVWVIIDHPMPPPSYKIITYAKGCADCTARGTNIKPDFWIEGK
jgi:hypothetical protein